MGSLVVLVCFDLAVALGFVLLLGWCASLVMLQAWWLVGLILWVYCVALVSLVPAFDVACGACGL